ncbi:hypothetical protein [uncultured Dokdonia sp.]|uniref:hypothetical protein n=1 Tax=uncultured Dokdonia sp. TaxID=575653 RepID=UPI002608E1D6|nr:hypothetical protein [uncultured Dokdonia sp.]
MATTTETTKTPSEETPSVPSKAATSKTKAATTSNKDMTASGQPLGISQDVKEEMSREINEMLSFAVYNGKIINTDVVTLIQNSSVDNLVNAHNLLCKNIAPATPKSIAYTRKLREDSPGKTLFSKLPLVRNLVILSLFFLVIFIVTGSSPNVNNASLDLGVMNNHGLSLLLNLAFLSSISGLGVSFYMLRNVSTSVKNGNLIPEDSIYYIALIVLGVIAGLILSEILNLYTKDPEDINLFNKSVLALLGGFSSDAIFTILQGLIDRLKSIFAPTNS